MNTIQILDCTLRDGGYCNQWNFGEKNIRRITQGLVDAGVEIVECGFLTNRVEYNADVTKYTDLAQAAAVIPSDRQGKLFVCMVNYGEYDADALPSYDGSSIDGIRVAFHKKDMAPALKLCRKIQDKGYKVFIQAMVSLNYTDEEFLHLIRCCNEFKPYAFYIVDSFGVMKRKDLTRLFYEVEHNLDESIWIGYHSHNNMQLAYSNAQALVDIRTRRDLILDSSIFGMGRGAGNLNTELITEYLNDNIGACYRTEPLLELIDEIIGDMYQRNYWGYSLPNYLSAVHNAHPNYAGYLDGRKTLTLKDMNAILDRMESEKKAIYDREYIEQLYREHMETGSVNQTHLEELRKALEGKRILLIAPGRSVRTEQDKVVTFAAREDVVSIGVNFVYLGCHTNYIFLSNLRRYRDLTQTDYARCIVTSNVPAAEAWIRTDYRSLTNDVDAVQDNAGLMAIRFLMQQSITGIWLAGFDGYSGDVSINYADEKMSFPTGKRLLEAMNEGMQTVLSRYGEQTEIHFLTTPKYITI